MALQTKNPIDITPRSPAAEEEASRGGALVRFDRSSLPAQMLATLGLKADDPRVIARERPGVSPTWLPTKPGDFIVGTIIEYRHELGKYKSSCVVILGRITGETQQTPPTYRTVWCGADLKTKLLEKVEAGGFVALEFTGMQELKGRPQPMRTYRVMELLPADASR